MKFLNTMVTRFWSWWSKEYLLEWQVIHKNTKSKKFSPIEKRDIVIVHSEDLPQAFWKLGKIEELFHGRDKKVRGTLVQVTWKDGQSTTLSRPIQLLYPLEIVHSAEKDVAIESVQPSESTPPPPEVPHEPRPQRTAARDARDRIVAQMLEY